MKLFDKISFRIASRISLMAIGLLFALSQAGIASAATTPSLGQSTSFGILSSTYTNTAAGTTINGDLGYTTPPAVSPTVTGATHVVDAIYAQAGIDQNSALSTGLATQPCTFTFAPGPVDLATDATHGPVGIYTPGVYCITGAASFGSGTTTLTGGGTYIFRMTGALNTAANTSVILAGGASACDVFWTPNAATTLGANSNFVGTDIDASGITIGSTVTWLGRALAFGGTVTTDVDTITVPPTCSVSPTNGGGSGGGTGSGTTTPGLPNAGTSSTSQNNGVWFLIISMGLISSAFVGYLINKKRIS